MSEPELLTGKETQKILRISQNTFYRYARSGKLPAIKLGGRTSQWKVKLTDVEKFLECNKGRKPEYLEKGEK